MSTHTPGPWTLSDDGFVYDESGERVADPHVAMQDIDEREANAHLIAAAPDLLAALEHCASLASSGCHLQQSDLALIQSAIARAKGE
jgi:hypothetical protein